MTDCGDQSTAQPSPIRPQARVLSGADEKEIPIAELLERGFDLAGTEGDDVIEGTNLADRVQGLADDDTIGGAGDDCGGESRNTFFGYTSYDFVGAGCCEARWLAKAESEFGQNRLIVLGH